MTIRDIITRADDIRSNNIGDAVKIEWLSQLDEQIYEEIIKIHEDHEDYGDITFPYTHDTQVLIAPDRWKEMYETYLMAKIDYYMSEMGHYSNDSSMHNSAYQAFAAWYNANHMPLQKNSFKVSSRMQRRCANVFGD